MVATRPPGLIGKIRLGQEDKDRMSVDLLVDLIAPGATEVGVQDMARFRPGQFADLSVLAAKFDDAEGAPPEIRS